MQSIKRLKIFLEAAMKLELTSRDLRLFQVLGRYGLLSTNQLLRLVFVDIDSSTALRRLRRLRDKRYVQSHSGLSKGQLVWTLLKKASDLIHSPLEFTINKSTIEHDVFVSEVRARLELNKVATNWISGHYLKQQAAKNKSSSELQHTQVPDGLFAIQLSAGTKTVALEVELVTKSKRRYKQILETYSHLSSVHILWYVVRNQRLGQSLCETGASLNYGMNKSLVYWSLLEDVIRDDGALILNGKENKIKLLEPAQAHTQAQSMDQKN